MKSETSEFLFEQPFLLCEGETFSAGSCASHVFPDGRVGFFLDRISWSTARGGGGGEGRIAVLFAPAENFFF